MAAIRFVIQGDGDVFTTVDGEMCPMENYDLILTPKWAWHDHRNSTGKSTIWLDALDVPLILALFWGKHATVWVYLGTMAAAAFKPVTRNRTPSWTTSADWPSGKLPTTRVRRRISRMIRSSGLLVRIFCQWMSGKA